MTKFFCTLTMFVLIVGAFIASCVIQVPAPSWLNRQHVPLALIAYIGLCFAVLVATFWIIYWAWSAADFFCTCLRKALDRRRARFAQKWSER